MNHTCHVLQTFDCLFWGPVGSANDSKIYIFTVHKNLNIKPEMVPNHRSICVLPIDKFD